jgi:hypothetical protein
MAAAPDRGAPVRDRCRAWERLNPVPDACHRAFGRVDPPVVFAVGAFLPVAFFVRVPFFAVAFFEAGVFVSFPGVTRGRLRTGSDAEAAADVAPFESPVAPSSP